MGPLFRLLAAAMTLALFGVGSAQAYDDADERYERYYSYYTRPLVYYRPAPYYAPAPYAYAPAPYAYRPAYYRPTSYYRAGRVYPLEPGTLPGVGERTHDRTGTLPGVTPRYNDGPRYGHRYGRGYGYDGYYARPSSCGRYRYARGGHCEDARWSPPFKRYYPIYRHVTIVEYDYD